MSWRDRFLVRGVHRARQARLRRAQSWVYDHQEERAEVWAKETGLPYEVAPASVKRTNATGSRSAATD